MVHFGKICTLVHCRPISIIFRNQNPSQKSPETSKTPVQDFEDIRVLCTFFFNVESWIWDHRLIVTLSTHPHHDQEPKPQSETSRDLHNSNQGLWEHGVFCTFLFNVESKISEHRLYGTFLATPHHDQEPKPKSGISRVLQIPSPGLRGHEGSLHLFIQCRKLNFGT